MTNSGVAVNPNPTMEMMRSVTLPSLMPAMIPSNKAKGITTRKAVPAKTSVLRIRGSSVTATGRPNSSDLPGSKRSIPLSRGIYSWGPSPSLRKPALVRTQTSAPSPRTHLTARFWLSTPQKYSWPFSSASQAPLTRCDVEDPSSWRFRANSLPSSSFQRVNWPSTSAHHSFSPVWGLLTATSG